MVWVWLALAVLFIPAATPTRIRALTLAARGRLGRQAGSTTEPVRRARSSMLGPAATTAAAIGTVGAGAAWGPAVAIALLIAVGTAARLGLAARSRRRRDRDAAQLLAAVRLVAAELDAGAPAVTALAAAADQLLDHAPQHAAELRAVAGAMARGDPPAEAGALAVLAPAWRLVATTGAPLAEVCRRVANDLAARIDQRRTVVSELAGARSSAALLAVLPVLGLLLGTAMQAHPVSVLLDTSAGGAVLVVGVALDAAGLLWTHWLAARAEGP